MQPLSETHSQNHGRIRNFFFSITAPLKRCCKAIARVFCRVSYTYKKQGFSEAFSMLRRSVARKLKRNRKAILKCTKRLAPITAAIVVLLVSLNCWTSFTLALEVSYEGETVGYAADESTLQTAYQLINDRFVKDHFDTSQTSCERKVVDASEVSDAASLCENILSASDELCEAVGLVIDGEIYAICSSDAPAASALDSILSEYTTGAQEETYSFSNHIEYAKGIYNKAEIDDAIDTADLASRLTVMVTRREIRTESIPYSTKEVGDASKYVGYQNVITSGAAGEKTFEVNVSYINGEEYAVETLSEEVTKEPVTEVIAIGKKPLENAADTDTGTVYFWPVARVSQSYISAYFGDGRNHKGIDICAPYGTAIYAGESGTVTEVGNDSSYGKYFIINHGDGYETLYSHCSSISVSVGQEVARGQYTAAVGMTGNATGNHLHFEVHINGTRYNPAPYLGIE